MLFESLGQSGRDIVCLDLPEGLHGKKAALAFGVEHASRPWIIQLDADCRVKPDFVASHMALLEKNPSDLLAGLVTTAEGKGGFLEHFERLDQLSLTGVAAASFLSGRALMCSGANLAYSKELYVETRAFDPSGQLASGDDMFLMIGARKLGKKLCFNLDAAAVVQTAPAPGWSKLLDQRIRWGAKSPRYQMPDIQLLALLVVICNVSVLVFPLYLVLSPVLWPYFLGSWLAKSTSDFIFLRRTATLTGQRKSLNYFLPGSLLYYPVFLLVILGMIFRQPTWKGNKIK
jgi:cellulose synthase/poly-beta-1,6-N-acetylglucosamine synthase-like glycosyltransferase